MRLIGYALAVALLAGAAAAKGEPPTEPSGFFGITFGEPLPDRAILSPKSREYLATFDKLDEEARTLVGTDLMKQVFPDWGAVPEYIRRELRREFAPDFRIAALVKPPTPNQMFNHYIALVTPESRLVGAIWAFGKLNPCKPAITALGKHLLSKYSKLRPTSLSKNFPGTPSSSVWLRSERIEIWLYCGGLHARHLMLESKFEKELEMKIQRVGSAISKFDDSGL